jgi:hypothetical protein
MEASKVKNGNKHQDILEIGKTIGKMVLASNFTKTEINMKACGKKTRDTDRVHIGETKMANFEENIQEIGMKIKSMVEELSFIRMEIDMMGTGLMACHRVKVE